MKKTITILSLGALFSIYSCSGEQKETTSHDEVTPHEEAKVEETKVEEEPATTTENEGSAEAGKALFSEKACTACHQEETKVVGPALKDIAAVYTEKEGSIVSFLKADADAIVDTDPAQVAVMKPQIETTKGFEESQLKDIEAYILSVK